MTDATELPFRLKSARGGHIWDDDGNKYIDLTSGWNVVNAGWNCAEIRDEWSRCLSTMTFRPSWCTDDYFERLKDMFGAFVPGYVVIPGCSGGDGIDNALKVARLVTGRPGVISFAASYHGSNTGAALAGGIAASHLDPLDLERHRVLMPAPGSSRLTDIEDLIRKAEDAGAIVFETVLTNGGCYVVPAEFLSLISRLAEELGILLICDEVGTGINRTGSLLSCQRRAIKPDIVVCGKALTNGLYPLSLCLVSADLTRFLEPEAFASTFAGAPAGSAAALATLRYHTDRELGALAKQAAAELEKRLLDNISGLGFATGLHGEGLELALHLNWAHGRDAGITPSHLLRRLRKRGLFATLSPGDCHLMLTPPLNSELANLLTAADLIAEVIAV
ncbi:aminotransferase class III-fold pyridoxal phosphate-dependent enzyme [Bradyrhizobium sp. YR681]|uniref:aminotransferase class III-fold pyridoxal phosphate-dependent enzyme n=1 Tax=Bradyrhizobium sp. YR681 TaxID=1144344 RepID=UPI0012F6598E|nr:aminotransferase class III-fold pyridoxal phosphate-dependent enzyme [Bradyrhizobium sp. YR681]